MFESIYQERTDGDNYIWDNNYERFKKIEAVLFGKSPTLKTVFDRQVAAVMDLNVPTIARAKIMKKFDDVIELIGNIEDDWSEEKKQRLASFLKSYELEPDDTIIIKTKPPILARQPEPIELYPSEIESIPMIISNLYEFETLCFNNKTLYRYLSQSGFASYLYQNLLHSLDVENVTELDGSTLWQARLAHLLNHTRLSNSVALDVFYKDVVIYDDVSYTSSFVPKYDVRSLKCELPIIPPSEDYGLLVYYERLDPTKVKKVNVKYIDIFRTFPFKNGYYIQDDGQIIHLNYTIKTSRRKSTKALFSNLCHFDDTDLLVNDICRQVTYAEAIYEAVYAENIGTLAIALLVLRRLIGNILVVDVASSCYHIPLPTENSILKYTKYECRSQVLVLPPTNDSNSVTYYALIDAIARSCCSELGAAMLCSNYRIPEINMLTVFELLTTDAQKYIFYTIIMQDYNYYSFHNVRRKLQPIFGSDNANLSIYPEAHSPFLNVTVADRIKDYTAELLRPAEMTENALNCLKQKCPTMYEFTNEQLNSLMKTGNTELNLSQTAAFIALSIRNTVVCQRILD